MYFLSLAERDTTCSLCLSSKNASLLNNEEKKPTFSCCGLYAHILISRTQSSINQSIPRKTMMPTRIPARLWEQLAVATTEESSSSAACRIPHFSVKNFYDTTATSDDDGPSCKVHASVGCYNYKGEDRFVLWRNEGEVNPGENSEGVYAHGLLGFVLNLSLTFCIVCFPSNYSLQTTAIRHFFFYVAFYHQQQQQQPQQEQ